MALLFGAIALQAQKPNELLDLARQYEDSGRLEDARGILEGLHHSSPQNVVYLIRLKELYLRMQAYESLFKMLDEEIRQNPDNPGPMIEKAQACHRMGRQDEAMQLWESVIQSNPDKRNLIQQVAGAMTSERLFFKAIDVYQNGRKALNDPQFGSIQLAGLYSSVQEYGKATREYLKYAGERPNQSVYVETQIMRMPKTGRAGKQILEVLNDALRQNEDDVSLLRILSRACLRWGNIKDGYACALRLESLASGNQKDVALLEFAGQLRELDMLPYAEKAYLEVLRRYPHYPASDQIWFLLGQNYAVRNESDAALAALDSVIQFRPHSSKASQALMLSGQILRDHKSDYPAADRAFKQLLKFYPNTSDGKRACLELGVLQVMSDSLDRAGRSFDKNLQMSQSYTPLWIEACLRLAETAYYRGDFDTALAVLKEMSQPGLKSELFQHSAMNDGLSLRLLIQTHAGRNPNALGLLSEGQLRVFQNRPDQAVQIMDSLIDQFPKDAVAAYGLFERASLFKNMGKEKRSLADLDTLLSRFPESLISDQALYESGRVCEQMGDAESAIRRYERFLIEHPASVHIEAVRKRIRKLDEDGA